MIFAPEPSDKKIITKCNQVTIYSIIDNEAMFSVDASSESIKIQTYRIDSSRIKSSYSYIQSAIKVDLTVVINGKKHGHTVFVSDEMLYNYQMPPKAIERMIILELIHNFAKNWSEYPNLESALLNRHGLIPPAPAKTNTFVTSSNGSTSSIAEFAENLPGYYTPVKCPCDCQSFKIKSGIGAVVMHLNDSHKWSREDIADWLDLIADRDGIDITFKVDIDD